MNHRCLLVTSLLAVASCQSSSSYSAPRLLGTDLTSVKFHGRLSTTPDPLLPLPPPDAGVEECLTAGQAERRLVQVDVRSVSVPRAWVNDMLALKTPKRPRRGSVTKTRAHNAELLVPAPSEPAVGKAKMHRATPLAEIPTISFLFAQAVGSMPVQWWGPRALAVSAAEANPIFDELTSRSLRQRLQRRPFAREMSFTCQPGVDADVVVTQPMAFVESFRCSDNRDELTWEPMIATAETGMALECNTAVDGDVLTVKFRLQLRSVVDVPTASSRLASAYGSPWGKGGAGLAVTVQAPLYSDHIFAGERVCKDGDAFLVFGTNTTAEDEVLLTLFEVKLQPGEEAGS